MAAESEAAVTTVTRFELYLAKAACKFNAAHFIAHGDGKREHMHGHNYRAEVTVRARDGVGVGADGYLLDFGEVKGHLKALCKDFDERFLCAARNPAMEVTQTDGDGTPCDVTIGSHSGPGQLTMVYKPDNSTFSMPRRDAFVLPLEQSSAELLAKYLCEALLERMGGAAALHSRGLGEVEVGVVETPHQEARCRIALLAADQDDAEATTL